MRRSKTAKKTTAKTTAKASAKSVDQPLALADNLEKASFCADVLRAMAHPLRLRIAALLLENTMHVNALADRLGVSQSAVSQQLRILRMRGLVQAMRSDGYAYYRVTEPQLKTLIHCMEKCAIRH